MRASDLPAAYTGGGDGAGPVPPRSRTLRWAAPAALAWSVCAALLALVWATGLTATPFDRAQEFDFGAFFNGSDPAVGSAFVLVAGCVGAAASASLARGRSRRTLRAGAGAALAAAAAVAAALLSGTLLAMLGYVPVVLFAAPFKPELADQFATAVAEPAAQFQLFIVVWGALLGTAGLVGLRRQRDACADCGRLPGRTGGQERAARAAALRTGRIAVAVAFAAALPYPAIRLPWIIGVFPGFSTAEAADLQSAGAVVNGVGLGLAGLAGAVLMTGLVSAWGVRFPRWMAGLSGRRVPIPLAVAPAAIAAAALIGMGKAVGTTWLSALAGASSLLAGADMFHSAAFAAMPVWGTALAVAAAAYTVRRRGECSACSRGLPEARP